MEFDQQLAQLEGGRLVHLDIVFGDGEERERPELAQLLHLRRHAACIDMPTSTFYPARGESAIEAKAACRRCPVRAECLIYALERHEWWGIWGGTSEKERRALQALSRQGEPVEEIAARTIAGDLDKAMASRRSRSGWTPKTAPYGWTVYEGGELVADEAEQQVIARLRRWEREGTTAGESARRLNADGVPTRHGGQWRHQGVVQILRLSRARMAQPVEERQAS